MRLYIVTTRKNAETINRSGFNQSGPYYVMGEVAIEKTPGPTLTDLSWHPIEDYPWAECTVDWVEIALDIPDEELRGWEIGDPEGGNRRWRVSPDFATRFLRRESN